MVTVLVWVCESKRGSWISGAFTHVQVDLNNKVTSEVSKCPLVITSSHLLCPQAKPATLYILEVDPCGTRIINIQHWRLLLLSEELLSFSAKKCKNLRGVSRFTVSVMCRESQSRQRETAEAELQSQWHIWTFTRSFKHLKPPEHLKIFLNRPLW